MKSVLAAAVLLCGVWLSTEVAPVRADGLPLEFRPCVQKGLEWLVSQQFSDGHWEAKGRVRSSIEQYPTAVTALCGMALLMEGSTLREGRYADCLRRAVDWLVARSAPNGLIGAAKTDQVSERYMYGHGFSLLFLSCVYGEEMDVDLRRKLESILTQAVLFTGQAQCSNGGWGYLSAKVTGDWPEGSVTITQMQALRAARNVGIAVPKEILDRGIGYLKASTTREGGVAYAPNERSAELALTSAGVVCGFSAGEYGSSELVKGWIQFCQRRVQQVGLAGAEKAEFHVTHDEYAHLYLSQLIYILGDDRYARWFPDSKPAERLTWSEYRKAMFRKLQRTQNSDGSWVRAAVGPVYTTALHLTVLQMDNATLPIYQR